MKKRYNTTICQYTLFSHEDLITECWLLHAHTADESPFSPDEAGSNQLQAFAVVNGLPDFKSYLGLKEDFSRLTAIARNDTVVGEAFAAN